MALPASRSLSSAVPLAPRTVPKEFLDPPSPLNPTVGLFLGGYGLAALSIWGWFVAGWPLPV
ncbi:MAG: beta-carotene hydroxylase, partial [Cyanobacteriota bacterium]|nr:beta-carotene hydroxylase [Cyanobacteriota bacterium]